MQQRQQYRKGGVFSAGCLQIQRRNSVLSAIVRVSASCVVDLKLSRDETGHNTPA